MDDIAEVDIEDDLRAQVSAVAAGGELVDYGTCQLDGGSTGRPQLNPIFRIWFGRETAPGVITLAPNATVQLDAATPSLSRFYAPESSTRRGLHAV